jgi:hypothetical protein
MFVLFYGIFGTAALIMFLNPKCSFKKGLTSAYVLSLFGGIGTDDFETYSYAAITIIFGTLIVTIVLLNIFIAYLVTVFRRLEEKNKSDDLNRKAKMVLNMEIIKHFFGKLNVWIKVENLENNERIEQIIKQNKEKEKHLYIVEKIEYKDKDKEILIEKIYKELKEQSKKIKKIENCHEEFDELKSSISSLKKLIQEKIK